MRITNFFAVEGGKPAAPRPSELAPGDTKVSAMPMLEVPEEQRLSLIVYVDNFNIAPANRNRVLHRLRGFLYDTIDREDRIMVVSHDLLVVSSYVKSVACVNKRLHYHDQAEITGEMLETMYPCRAEEVCPVELVVHGLPHRVLKDHHEPHHD